METLTDAAASSSEKDERMIIVDHLYEKMKLAMKSLDSESFDFVTMKWEKMICCIQSKVAFEVWEWKEFLVRKYSSTDFIAHV